MQVGQGTQSNNPLNALGTIEQNWSVASNTTINGAGDFGFFRSSSVLALLATQWASHLVGPLQCCVLVLRP
jgi:hypothetical protein